MTTDPTGDQPRWTVDQDGDGAVYLLWPGLSPSDHADLAALPGDAHAALVQHVRDAAEVPALRARVAELEAELTDALDPEEEPYSSTRILEARLEAAEAALTKIDEYGCHHLTRGRCYEPDSGRDRDADYSADAWCDACIARHALNMEATT